MWVLMILYYLMKVLCWYSRTNQNFKNIDLPSLLIFMIQVKIIFTWQFCSNILILLELVNWTKLMHSDSVSVWISNRVDQLKLCYLKSHILPVEVVFLNLRHGVYESTKEIIIHSTVMRWRLAIHGNLVYFKLFAFSALCVQNMYQINPNTQKSYRDYLHNTLHMVLHNAQSPSIIYTQGNNAIQILILLVKTMTMACTLIKLNVGFREHKLC